jgi:uncharacterized membrane protein HdeD (DUF308 family)
MKDLLKRISISILISSIIAFIIGLVMVIVPDISLQAIGITLGIYIILHGIALIVLDFMLNNHYLPFYGIMSGILSIVVGIILIAMPNLLSTIFAIALGLWVVLSSINIISTSIAVRKGVSKWYLFLILGIVDLISGIIILFNPFASSISIVMLGGIILMVHSVVTVVDMIMIKKDAKEFAKAFEESLKELKQSNTSN